MPSDIRTEAELGDWMHAQLVAEYGNETESWATERVGRITARLNSVRAACPVRGVCPQDLKTEILWIGAMTAFAAPGSYIYITRELLQQAGSDEPFAFVLAHEMAHHDLGHLQILRGPLKQARHASAYVVCSLLRLINHQLMGPENETAADSYALDLCVAAGYDGARCLELFDILEAYSVDHRDLDGVFGTDESLADSRELGDVQRWLKGVRGWSRQRMRGYPSLRERRATMRTLLREYECAG